MVAEGLREREKGSLSLCARATAKSVCVCRRSIAREDQSPSACSVLVPSRSPNGPRDSVTCAESLSTGFSGVSARARIAREAWPSTRASSPWTNTCESLLSETRVSRTTFALDSRHASHHQKGGAYDRTAPFARTFSSHPSEKRPSRSPLKESARATVGSFETPRAPERRLRSRHSATIAQRRRRRGTSPQASRSRT